MIYVNDTLYGKPYFAQCFARFDRHPILARCAEERIAVSTPDAALALALCLYVKERGGALYPLPSDMPMEAVRRRATRSGSQHLFSGNEIDALLDGVETLAQLEEPAPRASALIQTSSGTTGEPKFIARSWSSIDAEIDSYIRHFDAGRATPIVACPVNHSYGLISGVLVALKRGVVPVIVTSPNPKLVLRKVLAADSPLLYASPPLLAAVTMLARDQAPIHAVMTSGTLLKQRDFDAIRKTVRHLHQQYGCSEAGCVTLGQDITAANELGAPLPHVEIEAGSSSTELREIVVKIGTQVVETRDLGYMAGDKLHYVARIDDMINVSGLNVYPSEVEEVVLQIPGVTDAVVFKGSHDFGSDQVCLQFVAARPLEHHQIREWCSKKLAGYQVPMRIAQVGEIPKLPNGKISRKALAEASEQSGARSASQRASS